jgi:hypothetical protein
MMQRVGSFEVLRAPYGTIFWSTLLLASAPDRSMTDSKPWIGGYKMWLGFAIISAPDRSMTDSKPWIGGYKMWLGFCYHFGSRQSEECNSLNQVDISFSYGVILVWRCTCLYILYGTLKLYRPISVLCPKCPLLSNPITFHPAGEFRNTDVCCWGPTHCQNLCPWLYGHKITSSLAIRLQVQSTYLLGMKLLASI